MNILTPSTLSYLDAIVAAAPALTDNQAATAIIRPAFAGLAR